MRSPRFERWFADHTEVPLDYVQDMWDGDTYASRTYFVELAWAAWCEAINGVAA